MRNILLLVCLAAVVLVSGCGSMTEAKGDVSERTFVLKADNPQVQKFNSQLGEISNEASAENAVNSFVGYVDSRLDRSTTGTTAQSLNATLTPTVIKKMAMKEVQARKAGKSICSEGDNTAPDALIDIGAITDSINQLGASESVRVDDDTVSKAQAAVEQSMPNINPDQGSGMTPLEASVVGYALVSGDDGTASQESVKIPADKIGDFVETITN